jgi:transposase
MKVLAALAAGYLIGTRTGGKDIDQLGRSIKSLCDTEEFAEVVSAARAQAGSTLREIASIIDGERGLQESTGDLVTRVRHLVGHG